ncbi:hypothetical protein AAF712_010215 [Marasmius tenuissimus]|uniref:DUF6535 domain-containing protein n=1 Tax=Marasmius tenuissimus TaxID=585030 RepID=A0ABR2ZPF3_9AGAR
MALVEVRDPEHELGTKPMHDETEVQDTDPAPMDPKSAKGGVFPHATDVNKDKDRLNPDPGAGGQTPLDGTKTDHPTGNEDAAKKPSSSQDPALDKAWEVVMKEVTSLDDGLVGGWKEDIDTLLVFAGLFSAVVTAFTIESYQWLQEAPEDTTIALLKQISQQMNGTSAPEPDEFTITSSVVAINVLWFLSLIIALVDALFALLCKQWLREHRRHTHTRTPSEALALRWLRTQGLEKWHVPTILASLPMLLELALFLFLAGLLELLRTRHPVPFGVATIIVAFAALFYFGTTIIPTVDIIRQARQVIPDLWMARNYPRNYNSQFFASLITEIPPMEYTCPYKSPQSWVAFQSLTMISRIPGLLRRAAWFLRRRGYIAQSTYDRLFPISFGGLTPTSAFREIISSLSNWSSVDLELLQRSDIDLAPPFYELNAFRWLVAELRDSPRMIPHLQKILSTIPLQLVMPAVLDQWFFLPERKWTVKDIETALGPNLIPFGIENHLAFAKRRFLTEGRETLLFNRLLHWNHVSMNDRDKGTDSGRDSPGLFPVPFRSADANTSYGPELWRIYAEIAHDLAASDDYWVTLVEDLAPYIIASSPDDDLHHVPATATSRLVKQAGGCEFLSKIHSTILKRKLFEKKLFTKDKVMKWMEAMDIVRRVHGFSEDHFQTTPGYFPLPLTKLKKTLNNLSPTKSPDNDFRYLDRLGRGWGDADEWSKWELVEILSEHINNYPESNVESSHSPSQSTISPLVMSPAGLKLITFVHNCLVEEVGIYRFVLIYVFHGTDRWRGVIERVKVAHPELPPDHFQNIFHGVDLPVPDEHSLQQEVGVKAQAGNSGASPSEVPNTEEVDHEDGTNVRSNSAVEPSPKSDIGEFDQRGPLVDGDTKERESVIARQPVVTCATASDSSAVKGEKVVGGPDADKNV